MVRVTGRLRDAIIDCLSDRDCRRIMLSVLSKPKPTGAIEREVNLPQSTLYRKISELKESGLLMIERYEVRDDGRREAVYSCSFSEVRLRVEGEEIVIDVTENEKGKERRWFDLFYQRNGDTQ